MLIKDAKGNELLEIIPVAEEQAAQLYAPVNHALVVVKIGGEYLMGWNKWRQDWEIFGGCMEAGESLRDCINREGFEELGLKDVTYTFLGLMKFHMAPGYFNPQWHVEYGGLYGITLPEERLKEIEQYRTDQEEVERLKFYSQIGSDEPIAKIDEFLLSYWQGEQTIWKHE